MRSLGLSSVILLLGSIVNALQNVNAQDTQRVLLHKKDIKNVAIIGAGSAGSSAAHYLRRFSAQREVPVNITMYEQSDYVGGRSTTVNAFNHPSYPVELGASIFVDANRNLMTAVREFNLSTTSNSRFLEEDIKDELGIWDGSGFVFTSPVGPAKFWERWWTIGKLLWRYGLSPRRALQLRDDVIGKFLKLYEAPVFPFRDLTEAVRSLQLIGPSAFTGASFLAENGVGVLFAQEIVQASTRVNYAQNLHQIHGVETMVCLAADNAHSIEGGNWQIFQAMTRSADANVRLNRRVTDIDVSQSGFVVHSKSTFDSANCRSRPHITQPGENQCSMPGEFHEMEHPVECNLLTDDTQKHIHDSDNTNCDSSNRSTLDGDQEKYDAVIIAAPFWQTKIAITPNLIKPPNRTPFVTLHVTLFSSPHRLAPAFFGMPSGSQVPTTVLTTLPPSMSGDESYNSPLVGPMAFWSISTLEQTYNPRTGRMEFVYKIFSPLRIHSTFLSNLLGIKRPSMSSIDDLAYGVGHVISDDAADVSWIYLKEWRSYPYLNPITAFDDMRLIQEPGQRLWYTGGIEQFISTMETSSLMGMNVAKLLADQLAYE